MDLGQLKEYAVNYSTIPEYMQLSLKRYIENGIRPSDFLYAVLCNDLVAAYLNADDTNRKYLGNYAWWLIQKCPIGAWGDKNTVEKWMANGGLEGIEKEIKSNF